MSITIVRTAISLLVILSILERAHAALVSDDIVLGRQFVDGALRRLERAKADQDEVLSVLAPRLAWRIKDRNSAKVYARISADFWARYDHPKCGRCSRITRMFPIQRSPASIRRLQWERSARLA